MSINFKRGEIGSDILMVIGFIIAVGLLWVAGGGPAQYKKGGPGLFTQPKYPIMQAKSSNDAVSTDTQSADNGNSGTVKNTTSSNKATSPQAESEYKDKVYLGKGTAGDAEYPMKEYVRIEVSSSLDKPVNITGWKLTTGGRITGYPESVYIPTGTELFTSKGPNNQGPILLKPGEVAIITTGRVVGATPFSVNTSFKVNKCSGYLQNFDSLQFTPSFYGSCPGMDKEPGASALSDECYNYIDNLSNCTSVRLDNYGAIQYLGREFIDPDRNPLPSLGKACFDFMKTHLNYDGCVANHKDDADFYKREWRIFLNHNNNRLWWNTRDQITLYDREGKIVDQLKIE